MTPDEADAPARADQDPRPAGRPRRGLAEKRAAILRAALTVFGRDGYTRAGIDTIAKEAGVSTRTIYNHFSGKEELFRVVVEESSVRVREAQLDVLRRHRERPGGEPAAELTALARAWLEPMTTFPDHFALVRQIGAEAAHIPREVLEAWQEAGPHATHRALAGHLAELAGRTALELPDPARAATHFTLLTATEVVNRTYYGAFPLPAAEVDAIIAAGVRTFLHGHLPREAGPPR
ncbi:MULTISPECIES: TetR/AcrR family transcriptional regulator [Streptomycetaceae]|uniref:Transcriptional regulator, TetR family n=1 Tax=Streptantibioticus cattleyicolor (strain ATCC 35852 / DSM 46488 / JCM 4925 / NBRC 14057 / NRRL 8057) TaxID=1003195 RepID=F8JRI9_STREN|nr:MULTISPECIES: TetR/AcrR family transcriptional regulator [Streptomycetaceae]AEW97874.1 transcriptional regulator, TetR family [Streptantibioticus cattleyicolor NRRL 8057 = DSM 46488]MYS62285.1 TetR family transcriptional regulator [Streptomyces sp. SID5468]CCB78190.1 Transcriptional regulator, TetR family [Streptantibioticus cattleyicolor NRRL 8057 = DSM 46488]